MKFLADESVDAPIVYAIREKKLDISYISEFASGIDDEEVLTIANAENRILITLDKDFGELVYRGAHLHHGIVLIRLEGLSSEAKVEIVTSFVLDHQDELFNAFTVIQKNFIRIRKR